MTARKPARYKLTRCPPDVERSHYACLLRDDFRQLAKEECERLRCSQGVFLELLLAAHFKNGIVTADDVFDYDSEERRVGLGGPPKKEPATFDKAAVMRQAVLSMEGASKRKS